MDGQGPDVHEAPEDPELERDGPFPTDVGQLVKLPDGTFVVPRFGGSGGNSAVAFVKDATTKGEVPGVDATLKRVALTGDGSQTMYGATFIKATGDDAGVVTRVTTSKEEPYAAGFQKVVSTVVKGKASRRRSEPRHGHILPTDGGAVAPHDVFATVPFPDTMVEGRSDTFLTGQFKASTDGGKLPRSERSPPTAKTVTSFDTGGLLARSRRARVRQDEQAPLRGWIATVRRCGTIKIFPLE